MSGVRELEDMTTTQSFPADSEIEAILEQRIEQEKQSVGIVVGIIDGSGNYPFGELRSDRINCLLILAVCHQYLYPNPHFISNGFQFLTGHG
jgi:hypothetical protein